MPETPEPQTKDAGNFENAVAEMRRLESIALKPPESPPSFTEEPLFSEGEKDVSVALDYQHALHGALRVEQGKHGAQMPHHGAGLGRISPVRSDYVEQKQKREEEELRRMQEKFSKLDSEGKLPSTLSAKPAALQAPKPVSESERLQAMRAKLAGLVKKRQEAPQQQEEPPSTGGEREHELRDRLARKIKAIKEREKKQSEPGEGKNA